MIKVAGKALPKVRDTGRAFPRVDPEEVRKALGAEPVDADGIKPQGSVALFGLRQALAARLHSTGGRPGLGESRRQKIPLSDADWEILCQLAEAMADEKTSPTPGQVASELLHQRLLELRGQLEPGKSEQRRKR